MFTTDKSSTDNLNVTSVDLALPYPPRDNIDIHPKGPNSDEALVNKKFLQGIHLAIHRTSESKVTNAMLEKGAAPGNMPIDQVRLWIADIEAHNYTVICTNPPLPTSQSVNE